MNSTISARISLLGPALAVVFGIAACLDAQSCASGPPTRLGTVKVLSSTCSGGTGKLPRTTCQLLRVTCDSIPSIDVQVRVTEPDPKLALRGTVVFGVGGGGKGFYADRTGGQPLIQDLLSKGFRIVDRSWQSSWFGSKISIKKQSCRYATLLTWIHTNIHTKGAFCATGNSGGSGELGYALTTWGRGDILDVAVPSGGPPMSRLDFMCKPSAAWLAQCATIVPPNVMECKQPSCAISSSGHPVCTGCSTNATAADLQADSILHPAAVVSFPRTRVHVLIGAQDCAAAAFGMLFFNAITSEKVIEFVPGTPHWVATTPAGQDAIVRAMLGGAACRPGPGTLAARAWPRVGGRLDLDVFGPKVKTFQLYAALGLATIQGTVELPGLGWVFLGSPLYLLGGGVLDQNARRS